MSTVNTAVAYKYEILNIILMERYGIVTSRRKSPSLALYILTCKAEQIKQVPTWSNGQVIRAIKIDFGVTELFNIYSRFVILTEVVSARPLAAEKHCQDGGEISKFSTWVATRPEAVIRKGVNVCIHQHLQSLPDQKSDRGLLEISQVVHGNTIYHGRDDQTLRKTPCGLGSYNCDLEAYGQAPRNAF